jgi:hypothetical protein
LVLQLFKFFLISLSLIFVGSTSVKGTPVTQVKDIQEKKSSSTPTVSEISNVNFNSYDYQALQGLNSLYQCLNNNQTLERSLEVITHNHFAVLLYQCFNNLQQNNNLLTQEDIATIQRLRQNFETNFAGLKTRITQLENRIDTLEKQAFSPQVELEGEAIIAVADVWQKDNDSSLTLGNRVRLNFITSFSEKDQLQIRLQGRNIPEFESVTGTNMSNLGFDGADDNELEIDELEYEILLTENTTLNLYGVSGGMGDLIPV